MKSPKWMQFHIVDVQNGRATAKMTINTKHPGFLWFIWKQLHKQYAIRWWMYPRLVPVFVRMALRGLPKDS